MTSPYNSRSCEKAFKTTRICADLRCQKRIYKRGLKRRGIQFDEVLSQECTTKHRHNRVQEVSTSHGISHHTRDIYRMSVYSRQTLRCFLCGKLNHTALGCWHVQNYNQSWNTVTIYVDMDMLLVIPARLLTICNLAIAYSKGLWCSICVFMFCYCSKHCKKNCDMIQLFFLSGWQRVCGRSELGLKVVRPWPKCKWPLSGSEVSMWFSFFLHRNYLRHGRAMSCFRCAYECAIVSCILLV